MISRIVCMGLVFVFMSAATVWADDRVFVNGREVSSKQSNGKLVAPFPDVVKTPESPSGGPVPIPYPNTGQSTDTAKESKKPKADRNPTMMKKRSFGRSKGDESGSSESSTDTKKLKPPPRQIGFKNKQDLKKESEQDQLP